jgi:hypothetical protein
MKQSINNGYAIADINITLPVEVEYDERAAVMGRVFVVVGANRLEVSPILSPGDWAEVGVRLQEGGYLSESQDPLKEFIDEGFDPELFDDDLL